MKSAMLRLPLALRLALRELRGGFSGFAVFIACIALGVGAIAAVGSLTRALTASIEQEGQSILGGDISFRLAQRTAGDDERAWLASLGTVSQTISMRAMARLPDHSDQVLVEAKAVDNAYPLYGSLDLAGATPRESLFAQMDGRWGIAVEPSLLSRLGVAVGDEIEIGGMPVVIRDTIVREPDRLSGGLTFGPRVMLAPDALAQTGLIHPGSLVRWQYSVRLSDTSEAALRAAISTAAQKFPQAGWNIGSRDNAAPRVADQIRRFRDYLTLVGLTALAVGGVGVANAVRAHVEGRRTTIATLKALGAPGGLVTRIYLVQVLLLGALAITIGLALGTAAPLAARTWLAAFLPLPEGQGAVYPGALAIAALYGGLTALAFTLGPLGRARRVPVSALYRDHVARHAAKAPLAYRFGSLACIAAIAALAIALARQPAIAAIFVAAAAAGFVFLRVVALGLMSAARRAPHLHAMAARLAIANIHRPGALTPTVVLSLGLGLTLLVSLALIEVNINRRLNEQIPQNAPDYFFIDIPSVRAAAFTDLVSATAPGAHLDQVPMLRGRIVSLKGLPADGYPAPPQAQWVLRGDRGITYARDVPKGSTVVAGDWWPADYSGPPLVSFEAELAGELGLAIGDTVTVNLLGRNLTATIANLRTVQWETLGINFVLVFSPSAVAGAPHMMLTTVSFAAPDRDRQEADLMRAIADGFPEVTAVHVREALDTFSSLVAKLALAVRAASGVTLVAAVLVLAGALASSHRFRIYDAVVLKTLGATRRRLIAVYLTEFAVLGAATAVFAVAAGTLIAWLIVTRVMDMDFSFQTSVAATAATGAVILTVALGLAGTWRALGQKPAAFLRSLSAN